MSQKRDSLLWKLEHDTTKCEVFVEDYLIHPNLSILRGKVNVTTPHFAGDYPINLHYDDVLNFTRACNSLYLHIEAVATSKDVAIYGETSQSSLQVEVKSDTGNHILWALRCMPAVYGTEVLSISFPISHQLLRTIENGVNRIWRRWPGGKTAEPPLGNG